MQIPKIFRTIIYQQIATSSPFCPAGQFLMARLPEMKSFWTSTTTRADLGLTILVIQPFQQYTNSCMLMLPSPDTLKIMNRSLTCWLSKG